MFGLEAIVAGWLGFAATPVNIEVECHPKMPPRVEIVPSKNRVRYDFTKSKAQLNTVDIDTVSPYGPQHDTEISGLMSGSIQVKHSTSFMHEKYETLDLGCIYIRSVEVDVHVDPTVFIASEYPKGTCMHNAVMAHEFKHVREDQLIVNKYSRIIGKAVEQAVNAQKSSYGPHDLYKLPVIQTNIQNSINSIIGKYNDRMNQERRERQQAIDSLEEYESIGERCSDQ